MLKRNIAVLMITGGLFAAHANLAAAHETASSEAAVKVSYLERIAANDGYAGTPRTCNCEETASRGNTGSGSTASPFPWDNSKD